jgi:acetyl esterase/lipase
MMASSVLEPAAQVIADATANPPYLYDIGPEAARKVLEDIQSAPIDLLRVDERWVTVPATVGDVRVRVVTPAGSRGPLPVILYMHGGGWILGNARTHDRLVRELCVGTGAAVAFVEYTPSPEAQYPTAIEQGYATAQWISRSGEAEGFDTTRIAVAGDSVGGNMTAALALMAKQRGDVTFIHQSMYYPVTDAAQDTASYRTYAEGPYLRAQSMKWFWDAYTTNPDQRREITASPLRATIDQLAGLPPAFLLVDENDVLRDEGEAYAAKLRQAGVPITAVRYNGIIHDFMLLNPLNDTRATRAAIAQAIDMIRIAFGSSDGRTHAPHEGANRSMASA